MPVEESENGLPPFSSSLASTIFSYLPPTLPGKEPETPHYHYAFKTFSQRHGTLRFLRETAPGGKAWLFFKFESWIALTKGKNFWVWARSCCNHQAKSRVAVAALAERDSDFSGVGFHWLYNCIREPHGFVSVCSKRSYQILDRYSSTTLFCFAREICCQHETAILQVDTSQFLPNSGAITIEMKVIVVGDFKEGYQSNTSIKPANYLALLHRVSLNMR